MKYYTKLIVTAALAAGISSSLFANQVRITNNTPTQGWTAVDAFGDTLTSHGAGVWSFQMGVFQTGFTPTLGTGADWASNWVHVLGVTAPWQISGPNTNKAQAQAGVNAPDHVGKQAMVWGYNSKTFDSASQWVLLTNTSWIIPAFDGLNVTPLPENIWNYSLAGVTTVNGVGTVSTSGMQMTQAIPEPSTYALIFGLGILGFLGFRRFRK